MSRSRTLALASVPMALGLAWHQHRRTVRSVGSHPSVAPDLRGECRQIEAPWGSIGYRFVEGDPDRPALVLIHGWGRTADSTWWPVIAGCERTMVLIDLPGHGRSRLDRPFTLDLAAEVIDRVVEDAGVLRPVLVAHSMGGPVVLTALRNSDPERFSGLVVLATSAFWARPRLRFILALAPWAMSPGSPVLLRKQLAELRQAPDLAHHIAWGYAQRPLRRLLAEAAAVLRRFDARGWTDLRLPPTTWVVTAKDRVVAPGHQRRSARHFGAEIVELDVDHSMIVPALDRVLEIMERA
jgi:3-oxoadipate enol-lactonase